MRYADYLLTELIISPTIRFGKTNSYISEKNPKRKPTIRCQYCGKATELDFDPLKDHKLLDYWKCGFCGKLRKIGKKI